MLQLTKLFWDICRLQIGPQSLPNIRNLLILVILAGVIIDSFASSILMPNFTGFQIFLTVAIYNILLLIAVYLLLKLIGYEARAMQTVTAIAGSGLFISLFLLPSLILMDSLGEQVNSFAIFILVDNIWRIAVNAHIFRHALSVSLLMAMIISVCYLLFGVLIADFILPLQNA